MIEFAVAIALLVGLISTRKLWNQWLKLQAESTSIWVKDSEVELQDKIAEVRKQTQFKEAWFSDEAEALAFQEAKNTFNIYDILKIQNYGNK